MCEILSLSGGAEPPSSGSPRRPPAAPGLTLAVQRWLVRGEGVGGAAAGFPSSPPLCSPYRLGSLRAPGGMGTLRGWHPGHCRAIPALLEQMQRVAHRRASEDRCQHPGELLSKLTSAVQMFS